VIAYTSSRCDWVASAWNAARARDLEVLGEGREVGRLEPRVEAAQRHQVVCAEERQSHRDRAGRDRVCGAGAEIGRLHGLDVRMSVAHAVGAREVHREAADLVVVGLGEDPVLAGLEVLFDPRPHRSLARRVVIVAADVVPPAVAPATEEIEHGVDLVAVVAAEERGVDRDALAGAEGERECVPPPLAGQGHADLFLVLEPVVVLADPGRPVGLSVDERAGRSGHDDRDAESSIDAHPSLLAGCARATASVEPRRSCRHATRATMHGYRSIRRTAASLATPRDRDERDRDCLDRPRALGSPRVLQPQVVPASR
jgi:hypothetical protein